MSDLPGGHADPGSDPPQRPTSEQDRLIKAHTMMLRTIARPETKVGEAMLAGADALEEIERLREHNAELVGLLARLEWAGGSGCEYAACPDCENLPSSGHARDCELAAAIGAPREATP